MSLRHDWTREQVRALFALPFNDLLFQAHTVHRANFDANAVQRSQLLSIKTGACPEDCAYCPQSIRYETGLKKDPLMEVQAVVEAAREAGLDAWGLEVDGVSLAYAREHYPKNNYFLGLVEDFQPDQGFDLIYTSEVIEHVTDVRPFMAAIVRLLNPGGVVYVTTPDISHWRRPRDLDTWDGFNPPVHCVYFNPASMRLLLESLGLEIVKKLPAFKPGMKFIARKPR